MSLFPKDRDLTRPLERVELVVSASDLRLPVEEVHVRLDAFLAHHLHWRTRTGVQALVRAGHVFVDAPGPGEAAAPPRPELRPGRKLRHGARVVIEIPAELRIELPAGASAASELCVLYEDDDLLAIDKPALMAVHPSGRYLTGTLIQRVHARYSRPDGERLPIRLCHRLDRETSGIVLIAKNPLLHPRVMAQFEARTVEKEYLALVRGNPREEHGTIDLPLGSARASQVMIKMAVREDGQPSRTDWRVLERRSACALVLCRIHTGRQHQIRVHMAAIGHPLVGDKLYGADERAFLRDLDGQLSSADRAELGLERQALHSHRMALRSPSSGARIEIESPLAQDLADWFARQS